MPPHLVAYRVDDLRRVLVVGLGVTGRAVAAALVARGVEVSVADDRNSAKTPPGTTRLPADGLDAALAEVDAVHPAPGIARSHPIYAAARRRGRPIISELDLASAWTDRPSVTVTGTNGKTTVTTLIQQMCAADGIDAELVGNNDEPWVAAIDRRRPPPDLWVVEASSFRLDAIQHHRADVAVWLNFAPDHLDWHGDLADYEAAKRRLLDLQAPEAIALGAADDATVRRHLDTAPARTELVGEPDGRWRIDGTVLVTPTGPVELGALPQRRGPHDLVDLAAAAAAAHHAGVSVPAIAEVVRSFAGLPHRLQHVARRGGVDFYDDSKATAPHASVAALRGFDAAVLVAGGRNKGLDLTELREVADHLRVVIAIGEAAEEIRAVFDGLVPVVMADSMADAVRRGADLAEPDGAVVLSPACASFDWYRDYRERGADFTRLAREAAAS